MNLKYGELQNQIDGLNHALEQMKHGIENDDIRYIKSAMSFLKEKSDSVLSEAQDVLNNEN